MLRKLYLIFLAGCTSLCVLAQYIPSRYPIEMVVHRGANHLAPENTQASAVAAVDHGANWVELDVRRTRDNHLYNLHDETLDRTTNGSGRLSDWLACDVDTLDAGSWYGPQYQGLSVPTIAEMLDVLKGKANVFFDVKRGTPVEKLIALVREKGFAENSFFWFADPEMLKEFVRLAPEMKVKVNARDVAQLKEWMKVCRPSYVEVAAEQITPSFRSYCRKQGIRIMAAIQGDEASYRKALAVKPDMVNLDRPELFSRLQEEIASASPCAAWVDPRIGSEGLGRVFIGPSVPFGMVKPSPDCTPSPNSGWLPMPERVDGFSQVHVSGTGGGPKYGNILVTPFTKGFDRTQHFDYRTSEEIRLGYYETSFRESSIRTQITTARRASMYRFTYPEHTDKGLAVDAGFFLGESPVPDAREAQQLVGSEIEVVNDHALRGYSRIRGGWNNGRAYTVYFYAETDRPFSFRTWKGTTLTAKASQSDTGQKTGALLRFAESDSVVQLRIGISFISTLKAQENLRADIPHWNFEGIYRRLLLQWENLLSRIEIASDTPEAQKRMFYTALYHTMIMPVDRTGENPLWTDPEPYYDDFYAIWDTYRSSSPLITLIDQQRAVDMVRSLVNIGKRDGYMPDARSGNCNGRTQGGSNAEIVIADAYVKGLKGIDYEQALQAMLKDATVDPGGDHEAHGRGGLDEYLRLGYVPYGIDRAGNRTVEYAYCDYAIAQVAKGLGHEELSQHYLRQSGNWKNLWRRDFHHQGAQGFILPRDANGQWLDSLTYGHSRLQHPRFRYTPLTFEGPWYKPWWGMFFYEASSWEYSLSIPHDVPGLMEMSGGPAAFEQRLDIFFDRGFFNVNNEPSFLSPCLYHWLGKPERSSDRVLDIIRRHYSDGPVGLPGNDDSGAMSSWLAFHMMGLYPNAGQDYYLLHTPLLREATLCLEEGRRFTIRAQGLSETNRYIVSAKLNGQDYPYSTLRHARLMEGGKLVLTMGSKPAAWGRSMGEGFSECPVVSAVEAPAMASQSVSDQVSERKKGEYLFTFRLHGQTRRYEMTFRPEGDALRVEWGIERNLHWQSGSFLHTAAGLKSGRELCSFMPIDGDHLTLSDHQTAYLLSSEALAEVKSRGEVCYNARMFRLVDSDEQVDNVPLLHLRDEVEGCEMWVLDQPSLPLVWRMKNNPLEQDWEASRL